MIKKALFSLLLLSSISIQGFDFSAQNITNQTFSYIKNDNSYLNVSIGTWYMSWEQNDKQDNRDIEQGDAIEHTFKIENSFATELSINAKWKFISGSFDYILSDKANEKLDQYLGHLSFDTSYLDTFVRYIHTKTNGTAQGYDYTTQNDSFIAFDTTLDIFDLLLYPNIKGYKYFGIGYRYINYTLPQTIYVQNGSTTTLQGIEQEMQWSGSFITLSLDMSRIVLENIHSGKQILDWYINLLGGYGFDISPESKVVETLNYSSYLKGKTGYVYEADAGVAFSIYTLKNFTTIVGKVGYRYNKLLLETEKEKTGIYIYAKAESEFYGPYISMNFLF